MRINELSNEKLGQYKKKAGAHASRLDAEAWEHGGPDAQKKIAKANKRFSGIVKATKKEFANDMKKHYGVKEATDPVSIPEQGVAESDLNEFAPAGSGDGGDDDGFSEEILKKLAAQWWNGDEDPKAEKTLMAAGWEIGQDEGYDDEPGVFVVQAGDDHGRSYMSWPAHELKQGVAEGSLEYNTPDPVVVVQDKNGKILDKLNLSIAAQKYKLGQPQNIKKQLAHQNYTTIGNYVIVSPMSGQPQDATTRGMMEGITPETIHKLADREGVKWDNDPAFLALTKRLTGKRHLDDLDQAGLQRIKKYLENSVSESNVTNLDSVRPTEMSAEFINWLRANHPTMTMRDLKDPIKRNELYRQFQDETSKKTSTSTLEGLSPDALATLSKAKEKIKQDSQEELRKWEADFYANNRMPQQATPTTQVQPKPQLQPQKVDTPIAIKSKLSNKQKLALIDQITKIAKDGEKWIDRYEEILPPELKSDFQELDVMIHSEQPDYEEILKIYNRFYSGLRNFAQQKRRANSKQIAASRRELQRPSKVVYRKPEEIAESEVTEEMIAKRLSKELNLFKQGQKSDKELSTKPKDKAVHKKVKEVSDHRSGKIGGMEMEPIFVIHVDGKPKVKFKSKQQALTTYTELRKQFPDSNVEVIETQHPKNSFTETRK